MSDGTSQSSFLASRVRLFLRKETVGLKYFHFNFLFLLGSKKTTNNKVRRSLISVSNKSLSIEDVRSEITKQFNELKPAALCQPLEKVCVPGPPGKKGSKGSRGRRGVQGAKGKKGVQGIMGLPGRHGKQGIMGNQGIKGEKGDKGEKVFYKSILRRERNP